MGKRAIILAGGKGTRLSPYTTVLPKPLLPVGERAILEVVVRQLRDFGFTNLTLAVGYLAHLVRAVMQNGSHYGVTIDYQEEDEPLGTVGPLATIDGLDESFLVMNGDVLTALDYGRFLDIHREAGNVLTIASHRRIVRTEYGVLHLDGAEVGETTADRRLRGEARAALRREHGRLRDGAPRARLHRRRQAHGPAGPGAAAAGGGRAGRLLHVRGLLARHRSPRGLREGDHGVRVAQGSNT